MVLNKVLGILASASPSGSFCLSVPLKYQHLSMSLQLKHVLVLEAC